MGRFVWLFLRMDYLLLGLMIGDTGIAFRLRNLGKEFTEFSSVCHCVFSGETGMCMCMLLITLMQSRFAY